MSKYKNIILIAISLVLFVYAGFISIFPSSFTKNFDINAFEQKTLHATGLNITFNSIEAKMSPNFTMQIKIKDFKAEYPDKQPLFSAKTIDLITTAGSIISKNFVIKALDLKYVKYYDQILPTQENKLAYLPNVFDPSAYGTKKISITPGPVYIKNLDLSYTISDPYSYKTDSQRELNFTEQQVKDFLKSLNFKNVKIN